MSPRDALDAVLDDLQDSLTVPEVAALIGVHPATVYRAVKTGRIRSTSRGSGQIRRTLTTIPRTAVVEFLATPNGPASPSEVAA
ncbi:helix-turn-helix domain-containing protein [Streptomyces sp. SID4928]|uniref:helix-turn-helix domain-containing protein n=1 Tax=unclassified Streptomyces TaxID=2593676 RepID=UPI0001C1C98D|nr:helix-turn-helix domain-containing protein [Streptomyces sp. ACT-1]EGE40815.1 DNA binding domain protein, excisionase family [Streptomyces sp. ACT-1]MYR48885.1 helix-turn-helix domain-containing protein [Streptomyces sp. SID4928]